MPKSVTQYDLLISCPGDIKEEVDLIQKAVEKFNDQFLDTLGISIRSRHWSKSSYAQSGGKPQALLNDQFVHDCDAAVAILWTRFGTPTDQYGSGTEEEIEIMLQEHKQVFMYFSDKPFSPSALNSEEYKKVNAFKEKYKDKGIYKSYSSIEDFSKIFFADLTMYFMSQKANADANNIRKSNLLLRGIDEKQALTDSAVVHPFQLHSSISKEEIRNSILEHYNRINALHMGGYVPPKAMFNASSAMLPLYGKPAEITAGTQELILQVAEALEIRLSDDFFNLGNLTENPVTSLYGGVSLNGTEREKEKHHLIYNLHKLITKFRDWAEIEDTYPKMSCITLAIENNGTAIDRDIEVILSFPSNMVLKYSDFPVLNSVFAWEYLLDKVGIHMLLTIPATASYGEYSDSLSPGHHIPAPSHFSAASPFISRNYKKEYFDDVKYTYSYDIFEEAENCIVKIKFDYLKHNTVIAFPTPIFLKGKPENIPYSITSQGSSTVINGNIKCL